MQEKEGLQDNVIVSDYQAPNSHDKISRSKFLRNVGLGSAGLIIPNMLFSKAPRTEALKIPKDKSDKKPNIIMILCDQFRADACKREGFELDTTPFLDSLAQQGTWFNKAYCAAPGCVPSRTALQTGRFPSATRVKSNRNKRDAYFTHDLVDAVKARGYRTGIVGKTGHTYMRYHPERFDYFKTYTHQGEWGTQTPKINKFNKYLKNLHWYVGLKPAPFPTEMEQPYRIVSDGMNWLSSIKDKDDPFFLYLSIPEPHTPYQVSEPYYSMFPPDKLPPLLAGQESLKAKGKKFIMQYKMEKMGMGNYEQHIPRIRSNYYGMMRLIDDQIRRLVDYLKEKKLYDNTILIFMADHGDLTGQYGLIKKGVGVPDCLTRIPMLWHGPDIVKSKRPHDAHVSNIDIMPTICSIVDYPLPDGVIGRSLWPLLTGKDYPKADFASIIGQQGFGGRYFTSIDQINPYKEGVVDRSKHFFNGLNSISQSGILRFLRKDDWKLIYDMEGSGKLYNLSEDPAEINDLFYDEKYREKKFELLQDMLSWELRSQDPLVLPRSGRSYRKDMHNYWTPYYEPDMI